MKLTTILGAGAFALLPAFAQAEAPMSYEKALSCVQEQVPASSYVSNDFVPTDADLENITPLADPVKLRVGLSWIQDDAHTHLYNAMAEGFFAEEGLEIELVPGGPGKNHVQTLGGGVVDVAFISAGSYLPRALTSPTPITGLTSVGSILKGGPSALITIDPELQDRELTPQDLKGKIIAGGPFLAHLPIMLDKAGMTEGDVTVIKAGFTPDPLFAGAADFYLGWVFNQTRVIEDQGYKWNALMWGPHAFEDFPDSIIVHESDLESEEGRDVIKRFVRATYRGLQFQLENPEKTAENAVELAIDAKGLTAEKALQRLRLQKDLVLGGGQRLLETDLDQWDENTATLVQYGFMPTVACE